ncbi:MAG: PD-(D/E)XK motif protein [Gammaproteobacteria bacterium]|nr:PD-(D/E)XK motif protein [Gammaproteobacteria bacterium]
MTNRAMPWDEIQLPDAEYNVRLITGSGVIPLYWGKDTAGHCLFIVELQGDHTEQFRNDSTSVHGISLDLRGFDVSARQGFVLKLEKHVDKDLFLSLCETLVNSLQPVTDSGMALAVTLTHINRWKLFMSGRKSRVLSTEEIRGLFAELQFLRFLYQGRLSEKAAVDAWVGPEGSHQDFIFGNTAVEIKSISGKERSTVRISSGDQLETVCDNLFLLIFRLSAMPESAQSMSLNTLVRLVEQELNDATAVEELLRRLAAYGYVDIADYDTPEFVVATQHAYSVEKDFPRLIRSHIPDGIVKVAYDVELEKIATFKCDIDRLVEN